MNVCCVDLVKEGGGGGATTTTTTDDDAPINCCCAPAVTTPLPRTQHPRRRARRVRVRPHPRRDYPPRPAAAGKQAVTLRTPILGGKAKEEVGKVTGDKSTENEGKGDQTKSNLKDAGDRSRTRSKSKAGRPGFVTGGVLGSIGSRPPPGGGGGPPSLAGSRPPELVTESRFQVAAGVGLGRLIRTNDRRRKAAQMWPRTQRSICTVTYGKL